MRFFAHDGTAVHGPAVLDELMKLPGFDGDTLVCPVGSENSSDWKPALAYPPFREALLAPAPKLAPPPPPAPLAPTPPPPAPPPTLPCPRCARANPEDARFCNACAARMDGQEERPEPKRAMANAREPEPEPPFATSDPLAAPSEHAPALVALEPAAPEPFLLAPEPAQPAPPPASAPAAPTWRKTLIASFAGAALASGGLGWWLLRPAKHAAPSVADLTLEAAAPTAAPVPPAAAVPPATTPNAAPPSAAPPMEQSPKPLALKKEPVVDLNDLTKAPAKNPAKRARRHRAPKPAPAPDTETLIESHAANVEPAMPGAAPADGAPSAPAKPAAAAPADDAGFMLPGVPRRVPPASVTKPKAGAPAAPAAAAPAPETADDMTTKQVREQFTFCAQLLSQGAYADHFDTCLCASTRQAEPYHGRRGFYAANMKKAADAGRLETSASVTGIVLDGAVAKVTADWKSALADKPRTETETWQLEDGLWCRYP